MHLLALGLNHQTAPIELREKAVFGPDRIRHALADLTGTAGAAEAAILSTCNRTEIYCGQAAGDADRITEWLGDYSRLSREELARSTYRHPDEAAVRHTFRVASGLDSLVLGEPQILGQMKDAFHTAAGAGATGKILNRLFQHAFSVAKQVRTDTEIGGGSVSVAYTGVGLARRVFSRLDRRTALVIGAGETIELVARHLRQGRVPKILVANRTLDKARALAAEPGSEAISLAEVPARLHEADIVVTSTASTLPILGKGAVERARRERRNRPMLILDLAVPRDVEPEVRALRNVYVYTVDDLRTMVDENLESRQRAAGEAENIIDLQVVKFMRWIRSLGAVPAIRSLREGLDEVRQRELDRALRKLENGADPGEVLAGLARDLTNKIAHHPSQVLRQADMEGNAQMVTAARRLFNL